MPRSSHPRPTPTRSSAEEAPGRSRAQTTQLIVDAVGRLLGRGGFRSIGINAVAREAGVDKVLIYRYFGGISELLAAFAASSQFWPAVDDVVEPADPEGAPRQIDSRAEALVRFARALRARPNTQEILRWELLERNGLTDALAQAREQQGLAILSRLGAPPDIDAPAIASVIAAGVTYLCLRAKTADVYNGIELNTDEGWQRIEQAVRALVQGALSSSRRNSKVASSRRRRTHTPIA